MVIAASETFSQRNQNTSVAAMLDAAEDIAARATCGRRPVQRS